MKFLELWLIALAILFFGIVMGFLIGDMQDKPDIVVNTTEIKQDHTEVLNRIEKAEENINAFTYNWRTTCGNYVLELPTDPLNNILQSASNIKEYELGEYDCTEFSKNMVEQLKEAGFSAKTKIVSADCDSELFNTTKCGNWENNHMITELVLYVESTTGEFILPKNYKEYGLR